MASAGQNLRTIGFKASLKQRGLSLKLLPNGPTFTGLVSDTPPEPGEFTLSNETRDAALVSFLRADLGATVVKPGHSFLHEETGTNYRVTRARSRPYDIAAVFECEVS